MRSRSMLGLAPLAAALLAMPAAQAIPRASDVVPGLGPPRRRVKPAAKPQTEEERQDALRDAEAKRERRRGRAIDLMLEAERRGDERARSIPCFGGTRAGGPRGSALDAG
jgi:hypothetical protein